MRKVVLVTGLALASIANANAASDVKIDNDSKFALSAKVGTLGAGLDLTYKINPKFNARFNLNKAAASYDEVEDGVSYSGDLNLFTAGALLDFHPFKSNFRMTAGLYKNNNDISASSTNAKTDEVEIGDKTYTIDGTLNSSVGFKNMAPYLGIGWGNAVTRPNRWRFSVDAGVLFQGSPEGKLTGTGFATEVGTTNTVDISSEPTFQAELAKEEDNLNADLEDFKAYPVVAIGVSYNL